MISVKLLRKRWEQILALLDTSLSEEDQKIAEMIREQLSGSVKVKAK